MGAVCKSFQAAFLISLAFAGTSTLSAAPKEFLAHTWLADDGVPENSVLGITQTHDGYLWVASEGGLLRFNGVNFTQAHDFQNLNRLNGAVYAVRTDASGWLWVSAEGGMAVLDSSGWHAINATNVIMRSVAEDPLGKVLVGGLQGEVWAVKDYKLAPYPAPQGLVASGVFCLTDQRTGALWLANRGFVGMLTPNGWVRKGPPNGSTIKALIAASARDGGIYVYYQDELWHYQSDGAITSVHAPEVDQPRELIEGADGAFWIASNARGLVRFIPGGDVQAINSTNGLTHNAVSCVFEDREGNVWAGGSTAGLTRLKPNRFHSIGHDQGLPDDAVRSVAEGRDGEIYLGIHGGGVARLENGKVAGIYSPVDVPGLRCTWSVICDRAGRLWAGTYHGGLFVRENGSFRPYPLPAALGNIVNSMLLDSRGRIWLGDFSGLGVIDGDKVLTCVSNEPLSKLAVLAIAEDRKSGDIYAGTYDRGVFRLPKGDVSRVEELREFPHQRISCLAVDSANRLWAGLFGQGLSCLHGGIVTRIGPEQGLRADTVGSIIEDGLGWYWMGSTRGILRVSASELDALLKGEATRATFNLFNTSDGLASDYCTEGYQPSAIRDSSGRLWFSTARGVVSVNPSHFEVNTNPPPVIVSRIEYLDSSGSNQVVFPSASAPTVIPAGSHELNFIFDVLSYTAPEKERLAYRLEGREDNWVKLGNRHELHFRALSPGLYQLHIRAANNDGIWNDDGTQLGFQVVPFFWQTWLFRCLVVAAIATGGGFTAWRVTNDRLQRRIQQLQQQRALEEERVRLSTVLEVTSDLVAFADGDGAILHLNPAGRKMLGITDAVYAGGLTLAQLQPRWAAERVAKEGIPAARQSGAWESETALLHRDGREIPVSQVIAVHKDASGRICFLSTIARDITERKKAVAELQRREEKFRSLIENASDMITVMDPEMVITFQSPSSERVLGFKPAEMTGRNLIEFIHPLDERAARELLQKALRHPNGAVSVTARVKHSGGGWRLLEAVGRGLPGESGATQLVLNTRDITASKKLEEQIRQAQKMEAVGLLAGGVAHDFNNILAASMMQLSLLQQNPAVTPEIRSALKDLEDGSERAANLIRQLLLFSRQQVLQIKAVDFNELLLRLVRMLGRLLGEHIELLLHGDAGPLWVEADPGMLEQVVTNLCINARDAMAGGGRLTIGAARVTLDTASSVRTPDARAGEFVCLTVADTGCGMSEEILKQIFEPFFTTKEPGKGTGLGLATVFGIVKQHQGWIEVQSELGVGSVFRVYLPSCNAPGAVDSAAQSRPMRGGRETVLVVEDNESLRSLVARWLERLGYDVLEAANGPEALEQWGRRGDDVVLLISDMVMPGGMSGLELTERLRRSRPNLKVIISSGYSMEITGKDQFKERGISYLAKPYEGPTLAAVVRECLDA